MQGLEQRIQQQVTYLKQLSALLDTELHLISSRDPEGLLKVVEQKQVLLDKVHALDNQIDHDYSTLNPQQKDQPEIQSLFEQARHQLKECQYRTEINQKAVEQGQLRLEHLRKLLLETRAKENLTYDKKGRANAAIGGKGISA